MGDSNSIIDLGELSKPANTLIEKISDAVGGIFKPQQIRRVARAEADAEIIRAQTAIEITDLQRRALERFVGEEAKKQQNIESITEKALPQVADDSNPERMEDDWIANFFDKGKLISNEKMQVLWSRILAGEANQPGEFSKRTVNVLASLDESDAVLFSKICSFSVNLGDLKPLIYDTQAQIYQDNGLNFTGIKNLESTGLVHHEGLTGYEIGGLQKSGYLYYFEKPIYIEFPDADNPKMDLGKVIFTQIGAQLTKVVSSAPIEGFEDYLREHWKSLGYKTEPEEPSSDTA